MHKKMVEWQIYLGIILVMFSALVYYFHYLIFRDAHHIFIYMMGDLAFAFLEVLLVTLIIHRILTVHERNARLDKLNMVIGVFFSEVGNRLLTVFSDHDPTIDAIREQLVIDGTWTNKKFFQVRKNMKRHTYQVEIDKIDIGELSTFLVGKRSSLLRLLENPNLLEHESFTEMLRAVFHLVEEVDFREDLMSLPQTDYDHLAGDINRAYIHIVNEWLGYMNHLKNNYPYLFSLAVRMNPFDLNASPLVT